MPHAWVIPSERGRPAGRERERRDLAFVALLPLPDWVRAHPDVISITAQGMQMAHAGVMKASMVVPASLILLLLSFTIACTSGLAEKKKASKSASFMDATNTGAELYHSYCASCHGITGHGDGPAAKALKIPPPDITALARKNGGRFPGGQVYQVIEWGGAIASHGSREMPVWGVAFRPLSDENQKQVAARIRALTEYLESIQLK